VFKIILYFHITVALTTFLAAPIALTAPKLRGRHTTIGNLYHWLMLAVCLSAACLAFLHWEESWHLLIIAVTSYSFALRGYLAAKQRKPLWLRTHVSSMLASYIALWTAVIVLKGSIIPGVSLLPDFTYWLIPSIIGLPILWRVLKKVAPLNG